VTFLWLFGLGLVYFIAFIFPNLVGARDANMLSVFEVDEYAQYPNVLHMLAAGEPFYQTLRNFLIYLHYFYGYPFYFFSALAILPLKLAHGAAWVAQTQVIVATLRQMINVLPMITAVGVLVYTRTKFRSIWLSVGLFVLLLCVPGVISNNLWWHPDSLAFLFVVLVFFFLDRDHFRFGRFYCLAAAACGVAVGIKYFGLYFALAVPLYLIWGVAIHKITWRRGLVSAVLFVAIMLAAVVISNPLLLLPQERQALVATQKIQFQQTTSGILLKDSSAYFNLGKYPEDFRIHYGEGLFILVALGGLLFGLFRSKTSYLDAMMMAWIVPMAYTINFTGTKRTHYFLPVVLLLLSGLVNYFQITEVKCPGKPRTWLRWLAAGLIAVQFFLFIRTDLDLYIRSLNREQNSSSIAFFNRLQGETFSRLPVGLPLVIYRDWHVYVPPDPHWRTEIDWDLKGYDFVRNLKPDFILVEQANVQLFSNPHTLNNAADPGAMQGRQMFYADILAEKVPGYRLLFKDDFGCAFVTDTLYQAYLNR
jgi:hypothetical protein